VGKGRSEVVPGGDPDKDAAEDRRFVDDKDRGYCTQVQGGRLAAWDASRDKKG